MRLNRNLNKKILFVTLNKLKNTKYNWKYSNKSRFYKLRNELDSWRTRVTFKNCYSRNSFSFIFNNKFLMFFLTPKVINNSFNANNNTDINDTNIINTFVTSENNIYGNLSYIFLIFKNFFFFIPFNFLFYDTIKTNLIFSKYNNLLAISNSFLFYINIILFKKIQIWYKLILKNVFSFIFLKFKYKGKNYRWHRKKGGLVLRFGHSHLIYSKKPMSVFLKKKGRMKMIFFGTNIELVYNYLQNLIKWKPSNVYTGRGLRLSKTKLLKKSGKVSAYR